VVKDWLRQWGTDLLILVALAAVTVALGILLVVRAAPPIRYEVRPWLTSTTTTGAP
jgi:hypothetical protein